jgi:hypothetical protein
MRLHIRFTNGRREIIYSRYHTVYCNDGYKNELVVHLPEPYCGQLNIPLAEVESVVCHPDSDRVLVSI